VDPREDELEDNTGIHLYKTHENTPWTPLAKCERMLILVVSNSGEDFFHVFSL